MVEDHMTKALEKHEIKFEAQHGDYFHIFHLRNPARSMYQVWITFLPTGIVITGDLRITNEHALGSCESKDERWFAGELDAEYLASKFLKKRWCPELAANSLSELLDERLGEHKLDRMKRLIELLQRRAMEYQDFEDECDGLIDYGDGLPGYGYAPSEVGWLYALQRKFAELYAKRGKP